MQVPLSWFLKFTALATALVPCKSTWQFGSFRGPHLQSITSNYSTVYLWEHIQNTMPKKKGLKKKARLHNYIRLYHTISIIFFQNIVTICHPGSTPKPLCPPWGKCSPKGHAPQLPVSARKYDVPISEHQQHFRHWNANKNGRAPPGHAHCFHSIPVSQIKCSRMYVTYITKGRVWPRTRPCGSWSHSYP